MSVRPHGQRFRRVCDCRPLLRAEARRTPVGLACDVVVYAGEADAFEPPRGSWAQVSLGVVAVDDHRPLAVERGRRAPIQCLERDVDRTRKVLIRIVVRPENLDELGSFYAAEALDFITIKRCRHCIPVVDSMGNCQLLTDGLVVGGRRRLVRPSITPVRAPRVRAGRRT